MKQSIHSLLYVVAIFQQFPISSCIDYKQEIKRKVEEYSQYEVWGLSSVGRSASAFISLFIPSSIYPQIRDYIKDDHWKTFLAHAVAFTVKNQIPLTVVIGIGLLMTVVLIFFPCCVAISRRKCRFQTDGSETPRKVTCLFVFVLMSAAVAVFAAIIVVWSSIRAYFTLQAPFKFVHYAVVLSSTMKTFMRHNFEYRIHDISRAVHDQTMLLYNINEEIVDAFVKSTKVFLNPFLDIASAMHWQIAQAKFILEHQKSSLQSLINDTNSVVGELLSNLTAAVGSLKKMDNVSHLEPILKLQKLNLSADELKMFDDPINTLTEATKINLPSSIEAVSVHLGKVARNISFDPANLISSINEAAFKQQQEIGDKVAKYIAILDENIHEKNRAAVLKHLSGMEDSFLKTSYFVQYVLVAITAVIFVCMLISFCAFFVGVIGMDGCSDKSKKTKSVGCCFKLLSMCLYFLSFLVFICCAASCFMFFVTAIPLQYCYSWRDHSFFTATVDNSVFKNKTQWFNPFAFHDYGSSMKTQIIKCQEDSQYFLPLPDPLINISDAETVKKDIDTTNITTLFEKGLKDIPYFNLSDSTVFSNLSHALDKLNFSTIFQPSKEFLNNVTDTNGKDVLTKIKGDPNSPSNASKQAGEALNFFENLVHHLEHLTSQGGTFNLTIKSINTTLETVSLQMKYLHWVSYAFHNFLINDSMRMYQEVLNNMMTKKVDSIFFDMLYEASLFRKAMSMCPILLLFYEKGDAVLCNIIAQPMAVSWLGFFLLTVFLFAAILTSALLIPPVSSSNTEIENDIQTSEATQDTSKASAETKEPSNVSQHPPDSTQSKAPPEDVQDQPKT
ncbi:hypothetical protein JTE90_001435 [Oedothorax gibbosus]|uniref:Uncharacterized protein n=1 Tax=Oedothorax gibbosus TaxID=931172 RepID=A0AAV6UZM4_9ARAC|nr:hypothetical protein JTE90_001435 [Oedothorax gibbosus]